MKIAGVWLAFLDIAPEHKEQFNRWYDLDHMPEHVARAAIIQGRRYVATSQLRHAPGVQTAELTGGHPVYGSLYYFGGDFLSEAGELEGRETDRRIIKGGRYWKPGRSAHSAHWVSGDFRARPGVHVSPDAVPYLPHQGLIVMIGRASSADRVDEAVAWFDQTQAADLLDLSGALALLRFAPAPSLAPELILHLLFCREPAGDVMRDLAELREEQQFTGRFPAHSGVYESLAILPYQSLIPFQYDFDVEDPSSAAAL